MHRVELKGSSKAPAILVSFVVPNAPCGVESKVDGRSPKAFPDVPNAPCGVERRLGGFIVN